MQTLQASFRYNPVHSHIFIEKQFYKNNEIVSLITEKSKQTVVIVDSYIDQRVLDLIVNTLKPSLVVPVDCKEENKSRESKATLEDILLANHIHKDCTIICIGGGMLCDLVGFLASTYLRGVDLVLVPTTLLCMTDAAIGGKTAVNIRNIKNVIGTFYPARLVIVDPAFLLTLPETELQSGIAEVIKYGLIMDQGLFQLIKDSYHLFQNKDIPFFEDIIQRSITSKISVTERDLLDCGIRQTLNFGHTIGHGLEAFFNFKITHGQAIAIGMCIESYISFEKGFLSRHEVTILYDTFLKYEFPLHLASQIDIETLFGIMVSDKKSTSDTIRIICLESIGSIVNRSGNYLEPITKAETVNGINDLLSFIKGAHGKPSNISINT
ncbi:MAG: 3-dehydroquinate synthase [Chlamydiae bacterium]|nr:3-dehydroquinate synthase [Chlamydiota bacterium]